MKFETQALIQLLRDRHAQGQIVTYQEMSDEIHADVRTKERNSLETARSILERDYGLCYDCVHGVGLIPLTDAEVVERRKINRLRSIRNVSDKWSKDLQTVDVERLSQGDIVKYAASGIHLKLIEQSCNVDTQKRIEDNTSRMSDPLEAYKGVNVLKLLGGVS